MNGATATGVTTRGSMKMKDDAKHFWKYVKSKTSVKSTICQLKNEQGDLVDDSKGKADILNDYFSSVFIREDTSNIPDLQQRPSVSSLEHICRSRAS